MQLGGAVDNVVVGQVNGNAVAFVFDSGASPGVKARKLSRVNVQVGRIYRNCILGVAPRICLPSA